MSACVPVCTHKQAHAHTSIHTNINIHIQIHTHKYTHKLRLQGAVVYACNLNTLECEAELELESVGKIPSLWDRQSEQGVLEQTCNLSAQQAEAGRSLETRPSKTTQLARAMQRESTSKKQSRTRHSVWVGFGQLDGKPRNIREEGICFLFVFGDRVSLCSPEDPGTWCRDQAGFKLTAPPASASGMQD